MSTRLSSLVSPILAGGAVVASTALSAYPTLNGDIAYAVGGLITAEPAGFTPDQIFLARPIVYRYYLAGALAVVQALSVDPASGIGMTLVRAWGWLTAALAAVALWWGLRRRVRPSVASAVAAGVGLSLAVAPNWHTLQPDWLGVVLAVAGLGLALGPRHWLIGTLLGSVAFTLALGSKVAAAPWMLLAVVVIALLSWRRALAVAVATVALAGGARAALGAVIPWELLWLNDQITLVHKSPLSQGITWDNVLVGITDSVDVGLVNPVIWAALPAAVALVARRRTALARAFGALVLVVGLALAVASGYGQGEHFAYHWVGMPVAAAGVFVWAVVHDWRGQRALVTGALITAVMSAVAIAQPASWRSANFAETVACFLVVTILTTALVLFDHRRGPVGRRAEGRISPAAVVVVLAVLLASPLLPSSHYSFTMYNAGSRVGTTVDGHARARAAVAQVHAVVPADVPVLYLTYGATNFALQNPANCRYPSPQWLQRAGIHRPVAGYPSYRDNLACLTAEPPAWVVWDRSWFRPERMPAEVTAYLEQNFDCTEAARLPWGKDIWVCPRRA